MRAHRQVDLKVNIIKGVASGVNPAATPFILNFRSASNVLLQVDLLKQQGKCSSYLE